MNRNKLIFSSRSPKSSVLLQHMKGPVRFKMTNAYMFVSVLQKNRPALKNLIAALLHIHPSEIRSMQILNPIVLGQTITEKDCVLDILVLLNGDIKINLEMQIVNEGNWNDRAVYYLAGNLCDLKQGEDYKQMKKVIQVGILNFPLWEDGINPFFQEFCICDQKNGRIFSGKAVVNVLCLPQMENASVEDRESGLYDWAKLFSAATWEELRELAMKNEIIEDAVITLAQLSEDERIKQQCRAHEKFERDRINAMNYAKEYGFKSGLDEGRKAGHEEGLMAGLEEGRKEGRKEGLKEGRRMELYSLITRKLARGKSVAQIADELEETQAVILELIDSFQNTD